MIKTLRIALISSALLIGQSGYTQAKKPALKPSATKSSMKAPAKGMSQMAPQKGGLLSDAQLNEKQIFTNIDDAVKNAASVYRLHLSNVEGLNPMIGKLINLQELKVSSSMPGANIHFPNELFTLQKLTYLKISGVRIGELSNDFSRLVNLRTLDLTNAGIIRFPDNVSSWTNLETLNLLYNEIPVIPAGIEKLSKLKHLETSAMNLGNIPGLEELTYMITSPMLPDGLRSLSKLKSLKFISAQRVDFNFAMNILNSIQGLKSFDATGVIVDFEDFKQLLGLRVEELKMGVISFGSQSPNNQNINGRPNDENPMRPPMPGGSSPGGPKMIKSISFKEFQFRDETQLNALSASLSELPYKETLTIPFSPTLSRVAKEFKTLNLIVEDVMRGAAPGQIAALNPMEFQNLKGLIIGNNTANFPASFEGNPRVEMIDISLCDRVEGGALAKGMSTLPNLKTIVVNEDQVEQVLSLYSKKAGIKEIKIAKLPDAGIPFMPGSPMRPPRPPRPGQEPQAPQAGKDVKKAKVGNMSVSTLKKSYPKAKIIFEN